jgi:uncharacterized protein (DUF58 family)
VTLEARAERLTPSAVEAEARPYKWMGAAFGRRFFLLLAIGLVWAIPAFADPRLGLAMLAWDGVVLLAWAADLVLLGRARPLVVRRSFRHPLALSVRADVDLALVNGSRSTTRATLLDAVPATVRATPPSLDLTARHSQSAEGSYDVRPTRRGDITLGDVYLRGRGPLGLAERWLRAPLAQTVRVYPNLEDAKRDSMYLLRSRETAIEKRRAHIRGGGREFESLREYRQGDEFRDICWTASGRRGRFVTRTYRAERSQTIWLVIDTGRLMRARVGDVSKLDFAVNAALSLAQVALCSGDRVGLLAYGRAVTERVSASRGGAHLRTLIEHLADVREESGEADHLQAAGRLLADQKRRCLVVWLTDLAETAMTPEVVEAATQMAPRHLVLFVVVGQPDLARLAQQEPAGEAEMFESAAAHEVLHRRELLLARLRERGILALETDCAVLSTTVVNSYLSVKERNQL